MDRLFPSSKNVEFVDELEQGVAANGVGARFALSGGPYIIRNILARFQNIDYLHTEGEALLLEQTLGQFGIPDVFVGIHLGVGITAAGLNADVRSQLSVELGAHVTLDAVVHTVDVEVGALLLVGAGAAVVEADAHAGIEVEQAIRCAHRLAQVDGLHGVLHTGEVVEAAHVDVTHALAVARRVARINLEAVALAERAAEVDVGILVPVAVDVFGSRNAHTGLGHVDEHVRDGIESLPKGLINGDRLTKLGVIFVVVDVEVIAP